MIKSDLDNFTIDLAPEFFSYEELICT